MCVCVCLTLQCCSSRHSGCVEGGLCYKQTTTTPAHSGSPTVRLLVRFSSGSGMASPGSASGSKRNSCKWHLSFFHCWWFFWPAVLQTPHGLFIDVHAGTVQLLIRISDTSCLLDLAYFGGVLIMSHYFWCIFITEWLCNKFKERNRGIDILAKMCFSSISEVHRNCFGLQDPDFTLDFRWCHIVYHGKVNKCVLKIKHWNVITLPWTTICKIIVFYYLQIILYSSAQFG